MQQGQRLRKVSRWGRARKFGWTTRFSPALDGDSLARVKELPRLTLTPIGVVRSPWKDKHNAPRQAALGRGVAGAIELLPQAEYLHALKDIEHRANLDAEALGRA